MRLADWLAQTVKAALTRLPTVVVPICLLPAFVQITIAQEPQRLSGPGISPAVWGILEVPPGPGPHPAVVVLHGSFGWRPVYAQIAKALADSGFVALAVNYFAETARDTTSTQHGAMKLRWEATIRRAVEFLRGQPFVLPGSLALIGYSSGAFLAVSTASSTPGIRAVVDFFGGIDTTTKSLEDQVRNFPPLLILHGDADSVVPVSRAYQLQQAIIAHGGEVELHLYPGVGHAFNGPFSPNYSEAAAGDSFRRTIDFLRLRLSKR